MNLYLIRHADAVPAENGTADEDRPLSELGLAQCRALATALTAHGTQFDVLASSPLTRAVQTAEELSRLMGGPPPEVVEALTPGGRRKRVYRYLLGLDAASVALVGHAPDLGSLASRLCGSRKARINLAKAGVAELRLDAPPGKACAELVRLLTPDWLG